MADVVFIPELHDIGKLMSKDLRDKLGLGPLHTFASFDFTPYGISQPTSPSWWGQYHHMRRHETTEEWSERHGTSITQVALKEWNFEGLSDENKQDLFLLILADHLASSTARAAAEGYRQEAEQEGIVKLWNKDFYRKQQTQKKTWAAFTSKEDLKTIVQEIDTCTDSQTFLARYQSYLLLTPEDKSFPRNITSLYTHIELVGKIYRVLKKQPITIRQEVDQLLIAYADKTATSIVDAEGPNRLKKITANPQERWQARFVKCEVTFPHSFVRLRDINLLGKQAALIQNMQEHYPDEVLFATSDFLMLFLPVGQRLDEIFRPFGEAGFHLNIIEIQADLGILSSSLDQKRLQAKAAGTSQVLDARKTVVCKDYLLPEMPPELPAPLCDICFQEPGTDRFRGNIKEWIGSRCDAIREEGEPFPEYGNEWEPAGEKVCWFKFTLDQEKLSAYLQATFDEYIGYTALKQQSKKHVDKKTLQICESLSEEFRPLALQVDFSHDYQKLVAEFWKPFRGRSDIKQPVLSYQELGVFQYSSQLTRQVIDRFQNLFQERFPDCRSDQASPISLSLSIANIKYPIRDHWKYFEQSAKAWLNLRYHNISEAAYTQKEVELLLTNLVDTIKTRVAQTYLHNLIETHERLQSDTYLSLEIFNNRNRHREPYQVFKAGISPVRMLHFYRILKGH